MLACLLLTCVRHVVRQTSAVLTCSRTRKRPTPPVVESEAEQEQESSAGEGVEDQNEEEEDSDSEGTADTRPFGLLNGGKTYRAREDETCQRIAQNLGIDANELVMLNRSK